MKIGILTFHCAHNYGAVLQCYALQEILKNIGHEVEVINYTPSYLTKEYKTFYWKRYVSKNPYTLVKRVLSEIKLLNKRKERYNAFDQFVRKYLQLSPKYKKAKDIPPTNDIYIMGSDQIWNFNITRGGDPAYFGEFSFEKEDKIYISYAASMGKITSNNQEQKYLKKVLNKFDGISVREKDLQQHLQALTNKNIRIVLDPTLLLPQSYWDKILKRPKIEDNYILIYQVRQDPNTTRIANIIGEKLNLKVIEITAYIREKGNTNIFETCSPEEFLGFIKYASFVITTSFHGTVFSILFKKDFYCIRLNDGGDGRSSSLLDILELSDRLIQKNSTPNITHIDYSKVKQNNLLYLKQKSLDFLQEHTKNNISI